MLLNISQPDTLAFSDINVEDIVFIQVSTIGEGGSYVHCSNQEAKIKVWQMVMLFPRFPLIAEFIANVDFLNKACFQPSYDLPIEDAKVIEPNGKANTAFKDVDFLFYESPEGVQLFLNPNRSKKWEYLYEKETGKPRVVRFYFDTGVVLELGATQKTVNLFKRSIDARDAKRNPLPQL